MRLPVFKKSTNVLSIWPAVGMTDSKEKLTVACFSNEFLEAGIPLGKPFGFIWVLDSIYFNIFRYMSGLNSPCPAVYLFYGGFPVVTQSRFEYDFML